MLGLKLYSYYKMYTATDISKTILFTLTDAYVIFTYLSLYRRW